MDARRHPQSGQGHSSKGCLVQCSFTPPPYKPSTTIGTLSQYDQIDNRILGLYEEYLGRESELQEVLDFIDQSTDPAGLKDLLNKSSSLAKRAWDLTNRLAGDRIFDLLTSREEYQKFKGLITDARNFLAQGETKLKEFIQTAKEELKLNELFDKLRLISNEEQLRNLADERLKALVEQIVGKAFEKIKKSELGDALKQIHATLNNIENFKQKWYGKLKEAVTQNFKFSLSYAYSRSKKSDKLLDVEVNLAAANGRALAEKATRGDFMELLQSYNSKAVRINSGRFTQELQKSAQLQINIFGASFGRLSRLIQNVDHAIEEHDGGLLHVYTSKTEIKLRRDKKGRDGLRESVASNFMLTTVASAFQSEDDSSTAIDPKTKRFLARTLRRMSVGFDLVIEDQKTKPEELTRYLEFAQFLGLANAGALKRKLDEEFPDSMPNVKIRYVVRYDDDAVASVFRQETPVLIAEARKAMREFIAVKFIAMKDTQWMKPIGWAYRGADPAKFDQYIQAHALTVHLPADLADGGDTVELRDARLELFKSLLMIERTYLKRLGKFDQVVDQARQARTSVPIDELNDASRGFLDQAKKLESWRANAFFAVFDHLVEFTNKGKGRRETSMVIEVDAGDGKKVTKIISSPPAAGAEEQDSPAAAPTPPMVLAASA